MVLTNKVSYCEAELTNKNLLPILFKYLQVHIALDDQKLENGVLHYIPGSHRYNLICLEAFNTITIEMHVIQIGFY
jgi:ectoine hydroxylase-related dioxygenase (phytanoyl-CoA dioxygenase family)